MIRRECLILLSVVFVALALRHEDAGWKLSNNVFDPSHPHTISIALSQRNLPKLEQLLWRISNPKSPLYAQYLSTEEIRELVGNPEAVKAVSDWLIRGSVRPEDIEVNAHHDLLTVRTTVRVIEELFGVQMKAFETPYGLKLRTLEDVVVPSDLAKHIDLIHHINDFPPSIRKSRSRSTAPSSRSSMANQGAHITEVAGRGGEQILLVVFNTCTSTNTPCDKAVSVQINVTSAYPNLAPSTSTTIPVPEDCAAGNVSCRVQVPAAFYVPYNIYLSITYETSQGPTEQWPYQAITTPIILPQTLAAQYNVPPSSRVTNPGATQAVVEFEQQYYSQADLVKFLEATGLGEPVNVTIVGPNPPQPGGEANLDIQWIMALAPGAPTTFWSIQANSTAEIDHVLTWTYQMNQDPHPPLVNSLSYGMVMSNVDYYLGQGYINRTEAQLMILAIRGITILFSSGDSGSGGLGGPPMTQNLCKPLHPQWPSNSPYVVAVGATYLTPLAEPVCFEGVNCLQNPVGEVAVSVENGLFWTSGGGFADYPARPAYQAAAVKHYVAAANGTFPPTGYFNPNGRVYPDVTACGHNLLFVMNGNFGPIDGTSASTPVTAAMVTLLNDALLNAGKMPLGFINPLLYEIAAERPEAFGDVTVGNIRCGTDSSTPVCCPYGFEATQGFDAVGGLGSFNFGVIKDYLFNIGQ